MGFWSFLFVPSSLRFEHGRRSGQKSFRFLTGRDLQGVPRLVCRVCKGLLVLWACSPCWQTCHFVRFFKEKIYTYVAKWSIYSKVVHGFMTKNLEHPFKMKSKQTRRHLCSGLTSHCFHKIRDGHQANNKGLCAHDREGFPIEGGMTIPPKATFDPGPRWAPKTVAIPGRSVGGYPCGAFGEDAGCHSEGAQQGGWHIEKMMERCKKRWLLSSFLMVYYNPYITG